MSKTKRKTRKINKQALLTILVVFVLIIGLIGGGTGLVVLGSMLKDKPELEINNLFSKESSKIYDKDGNQIADVGTQIRTNITYNELPESLIDAFVSIEDSRFFEHGGFDSARFIKAMIENIKEMRFAQGGSTLTMQLIKLSYFTDDEAGVGAPKKIERKVQEIALALELENDVDKKTILELYINKINFGGSGNIRGVQKASQYYFGKDVSKLSTPESAMLAGIVNRPTAYNPFNYLDYATTRRNTVLNMMVRHGYITEKQGELFKSIKLENMLVDPSIAKGSGAQEYEYQSYIDTAIAEAKQLTGLDPTSVAMEIYTYMDPSVQKIMDSIQADQEESVAFPDELMEVAMISIDNDTGAIVAIGGGRNYGRGGSMLLNHATEQYKQPGSSVKPFLSYALAFEHLGWATSHVVTDKPIVYKGTSKVIKNATNTYEGQVTLEYALEKSLNTPAIQTLQDVVDNIGGGAVVQYLQSLGFSKVEANNFDIGFAIGGSNFTASAQELVAAQAAMINGGNYIKPHTIAKIEFKNNSEPIEPGYAPTRVISEASSYLITQLMYKVVNGPIYNYMQLLKRDYPVYGKTGTTDWGSDGLQYNIPQGAAKDKWMLSSTSKYSTAIWVGYEKGVKDKDTYFSSAKSKLNLPGNISNLILSALTDDLKPEGVKRPEGISSITHILGTFPYASPIEGMDGSLITTGLIKNEFNKLVNPETSDISQLDSFSATIGNDGTINMVWSPYPDESKLQMAPDTMDLGLQVGNSWVGATGRRIFDYTWIYGPIRYKARILQDGAQIDEISSETNNLIHLVSLQPGATITVCGYYAYENLGTSSNEICAEFKAVDTDIDLMVPSDTAGQVDIENWVNSSGISATINIITNDSKANTNEILYNGVKVNNQVIKTTSSALANIEVTVNIYTASQNITTPEPQETPE
ncbi:MAG: penicillin-binding protein [Erysipelotrichaceae bacterium]|nr:penicillin-binding protein [Erysipelotrichaceae bacterium]